MIRRSVEHDADTVMQIWLDTNVQAHFFIPSHYWDRNFEMVREMLPYAEIYVHEDDYTNQIDGFIGLNGDYIEGIFVKGSVQSRGIGKELLDYAKGLRHTLCLNVYQMNKGAIKFYLREKFKIQSEDVDDNTGEKEFTMAWNG